MRLFNTKLTFFATIITYMVISVSVYAGGTFPEIGIKDDRTGIYAYTNAVLIPSPGEKIENATLLIRNNKIHAAGRNVNIPDNAVVIDLHGAWIYPSFIELQSNYGIPDAEKKESRSPQYDPLRTGAFAWNDALNADFKAHIHFRHKKEQAEKLRKNGFGTVLSHRHDGIARGTGTIVTLDEQKENKSILSEQGSVHYSFDKGSSQQQYPRSLMGSIALLRQTFLDAEWYKNGGYRAETNVVLSSLNNTSELPSFLEINEKNDIYRVTNIDNEFNKNFIITGSNDHYQLGTMPNPNQRFVIQLNFPEPYDVSDPYDAREVTLRQLKHWEMAPFNPAFLHNKDVSFAISASGSKNNSFLKDLRIAVKAGLPEDVALRALTLSPAEFLNIDNLTGSLEAGKLANFIITSGNIFDPETKIFENHIQGKPFRVNERRFPSPDGTYRFYSEVTDSFRVIFQGNRAKIMFADSDTLETSFSTERNYISLHFRPENLTGIDGTVRLSGSGIAPAYESLSGEGQLLGNQWFQWVAEKISAAPDTAESEKEIRVPEEPGDMIYPFRAYGRDSLPQQEKILVKNATLWTNDEAGILENHDILIENGKISRIARSINPGNARVIEGDGLHVTPGIIDEHSHIAISRGVNEGSHAITSEVRISDVINPDDVNIYRQLSGGVTAAQLLHGSANPVGGQSAFIKLRWGETPENMLFEDAPSFIKFALGENVKQSHWGSNHNQRYPQTRMGVEQIIKEFFHRAQKYQAEWEEYNNQSGRQQDETIPPRRDLQLEALVEILKDERKITCHSYVQSEINMLIKLADSMGFKINTFTHIIDGYKVADKLKDHGAGASAFTDWWNIKPELSDGIPHNTSILTRKGVTTSIQSDNAELGRRLNHEAAKAVMYADLDEEDALKLATLNPAKLLGVDDRVGRLTTGMDADIVIWNNHPLSVYASPQYTLIDGKVYFDRQEHNEMMTYITAERERIMENMLKAKENGSPVKPVEKEDNPEWHCMDGVDD